MANEPTLKPCPFCGSPAKMLHIHGEFKVTCTLPGTCYGHAPNHRRFGFILKADAARLWNQRTEGETNA